MRLQRDVCPQMREIYVASVPTVGRRALADRRPLHDDKARTLQVLHRALGEDPRHHLRCVMLPLAAGPVLS